MKNSKYAGAWLVGVSITVFASGSLNATELLQRGGPGVHMTTLAEGSAPMAERGEVHVFVRLSTPSLAEFCVNETLAGRPIPDAATQKAHAALIDAEQAGVRAQLAGLGARELSSLRAGDNGMRVLVDSSQLAGIRSIAGVSTVAPVTLHTKSLTRSVPWIGAARAHNAGVKGKGVSIGIIDSGIDYTHAHLGGSGDPNDYINNDPNVVEPGTFPTRKVVGGYDFAGAAYDAGDPANSTPVPDADPLDGDGHGSHVAGIAAGLGVPGSIGMGVAPKAKLYALKVFGEPAGSTALTSDAIEWALDPNGDGDISDHLDVINMSLGSSFGSPDDPSAVSSSMAAKMGVVVVASAGNSGPIPYVTGAPAAAGGAVMSVASSLSGGPTLGVETSGDVAGAHEALEGTSPVRLADGSVTADLMQVSDAANIEGCSAIGDDMTGYIALISRGTCGFADKSANAEAAGAVGMIVYNDGATDERIAPIVMGGLDAATIPSVMVSYFAGADLSASLGGGGAIVANMDESIMVDTIFGDTMSGFSSRGPGHGGSTFKPDLAAPGSSIVSTLYSTGTEGASFNGTSMAAPHVAGAAALLLQKHPGASPEAVKAMLQNSSTSAVGAGTVGPTPPLARQGTGRINADSALKLKSYATPGGVTFGRINPYHPVTVKRAVSIKSHDKSGHYSVTHEPNQTFPGVTVNCPDSAGHHGKHHITLTMDPAAGDYDDAFHSQTEVDGWCVFDNGHDTLRVGYLAVVDPASKMGASEGKGHVKIANKAGNVGWAEGFTLAAEGDALLYDVPNSFRATGFRSGSFAALGDLVEFGVASQAPWETFAAYEIDIFVDHDGDGIDDYILVAADFFGDGVPITAIFPQGAALFSTGTDLNDASIIMTFFGAQDAPLGSLGFLPAGDHDFDYTALFFGRDGSVGLQTGHVDLSKEVVPAFNSFGLFPYESVDVPVSGKGEMLWLFQNNKAESGKGDRQGDIVKVKGY
ncbi:MAG: S8 family serine peptidase [Gammaproteobacteria bacterium]|nr:S8 family serine peptidase [Gammaproteobacteria bacterium]